LGSTLDRVTNIPDRSPQTTQTTSFRASRKGVYTCLMPPPSWLQDIPDASWDRLARTVELASGHRAQAHASAREFVDTVSGKALLVVPPGALVLGLSQEEELVARRKFGRIPQGVRRMRPVHHVTVAPFLIMRTPIDALAAAKFKLLPDDARPASGFAERQNEAPGFLYWEEVERMKQTWKVRLPSESEWEHACRAGTRSLFWFGDSPVADESQQQWVVAPPNLDRGVPNAFGLTALHFGEWCDDLFRPNYGNQKAIPGEQVVRGGGAMLWPFQNHHEWFYCASAFRLRAGETDGANAVRPIVDWVNAKAGEEVERVVRAAMAS
jgi:formylglycine-generating enzyme required for sulfatase activity